MSSFVHISFFKLMMSSVRFSSFSSAREKDHVKEDLLLIIGTAIRTNISIIAINTYIIYMYNIYIYMMININ